MNVLLFAALAALTTIGVTGAGYSNISILDPGTQLSVHLTSSLSSTTANAGDSIALVAGSPLVVQGNVVVVTGAVGQGHVVSVTPPKANKAAAIAIAGDWITAVDGQHVPIAASKKGGPFVFGAGGPSESSYAKGQPIEVNASTPITMFVSEQRTIQITTTQ